MWDRGTLKKELNVARFKLLLTLPILVIMAVAIPLTYEYLLDILQTTPIPGMFAQQAEQLKNYSYYIWSQWFGKNLMQFGTILALIFGAGLISSEANRKTIYFLLTKPISRERVYAIKYLINLLCLEAILLISSLFLYVTVMATGKSYSAALFFENHMILAAGTALVFTIAMYWSNVFDQTMKGFLVSGLIAIFLSLPGYFEPIQNFSIFYHMQGVQIISGSGFPFLAFVIMVFVSGVIYKQGMHKFVARDW